MTVAEIAAVESIANALLAEFEIQALITRRFLERIPEDRLTWKPHEKSLTAGQKFSRRSMKVSSRCGTFYRSSMTRQCTRRGDWSPAKR
jgi:hypothetical protein